MRKILEACFWRILIAGVALYAGWNALHRGDVMDDGIAISAGIVTGYCCLSDSIRLLAWHINRKFKKRARKIFLDIRAWYSCEHEYRIASLDEFPDANTKYYLEMKEKLEPEGFAIIADIEDLTNSRIYPKSAACERLLRSRDGRAYAVLSSNRWPSDVPSPAAVDGWTRHLVLRTQFSDGMFLVTQFVNGMPKYQSGCPQYCMEEMAWDKGVPALVSLHARRVTERLVALPEASVVQVRQVEDVFSAMSSLQRHINRHRQEQGFISPGDVRGMTQLGPKEGLERLAVTLEQVIAEEGQRATRGIQT